MKTIKNIREALDSNISTGIKIRTGHDGLIKVTAHARFPKDDAINYFCKWVTFSYADSLYMELYGKPVTESQYFIH